MRARSRDKKNIRVKVALLLIFVFMLAPLTAFAQFGAADTDVCRVSDSDVRAKKAVEVTIPIPGITYELKNNDGKDAHFVKDMGCYVVGIYRYFAGVAGILATVMMMWGGIQYILSLGNPQKLSEAKDTITGALIGLLLTLGSFSILYLINPNLTVFSVPQIEHVAEVKWGDCGPYASFSQARDECVLECPTDYAVTDCYMCIVGLSKHNVVWSNDLCSTTDLGIGKLQKVQPGLADAIQDTIGDVLYAATVGTEIFLFGGPQAATFKAAIANALGTTIKITAINQITDVRTQLAENPMYQGKIVFTDPKAACCVSEKSPDECSLVNGFADLWTGECSGTSLCRDNTKCGETGANGCVGIYAENGICTITTGETKTDTETGEVSRVWEYMSTVESDPAYHTWARVIYTDIVAAVKVPAQELCTPNQIGSVELTEQRGCGEFFLTYDNWGNASADGLGVFCPESNQQCLIVHTRQALNHLITSPLFQQKDGQVCVPQEWNYYNGTGWGTYVGEYDFRMRYNQDAGENYWWARGGHCITLDL